MYQFDISRRPRQLLKILCLGAHCDDIDIGCGGTLLKILEKHENVFVTWVIFSSNPERAAEAQTSAELFLKDAKTRKIIIR